MAGFECYECGEYYKDRKPWKVYEWKVYETVNKWDLEFCSRECWENWWSYFEKQHPGFRIQCKNCGSYNVQVENTLGFSSISGAWGYIAFKCHDCRNETKIFEID